jgi:hypothetical protein
MGSLMREAHQEVQGVRHKGNKESLKTEKLKGQRETPTK